MTSLAGLLFGRRARLRWIHLILGGALAVPYVLVGSVVVGPVAGDADVFGSLRLQLASFAVGLPPAAVTSLFPLTRPLESGVVRSLCGVGPDRLAHGPARTRGEKGRTAAWFTLHLGLGGVVAGMSLAVPPFAVALMALPFVPALRDDRAGLPGVLRHTWSLALAPVAGAAMLVALAGCAAVCGALLARWAPALLGPTGSRDRTQAVIRAYDAGFTRGAT
ncbi:hypothetical protein ACF07W_34880 [Streptomyces sp. NPDC015140]|uniref:hypothetical protein n=1 Tax=Streptomyces sp. NPDC015140 TaxID=3364943 RepID=UPI00370202B1